MKFAKPSGLVTGRFPRRALKAVLEWHEINQAELMDVWQLAEQGRPLHRIEPLE